MIHKNTDTDTYKKKSSVRGFTLIEFAFTLAISAVILSLTVTTFINVSNLQALDRGVEAIAGHIIKARNKTINSQGAGQFGVKLATNTVTVFQGTTYSATATTTNFVFDLPSKMQMSSNLMKTNGSVVTSFYFEPISGKPTATGTIQYQLISDPTNIRTITIYGSGLIETQ
jgi:prepilin-type N-terminal cleavage/methylation domain-containing protein